ncbi:hypothetical protein IG631_14135 [Alternaria alternata]|nr:hypothetical protein IG631_14135 [Alternaria alternata]
MVKDVDGRSSYIEKNSYVLLPLLSPITTVAPSLASKRPKQTPRILAPPNQCHQICTRYAFHPRRCQVSDYVIQILLVFFAQAGDEFLPVLGLDVFVDLAFAEDIVCSHSDVVIGSHQDLLAAVGGQLFV